MTTSLHVIAPADLLPVETLPLQQFLVDDQTCPGVTGTASSLEDNELLLMLMKIILVLILPAVHHGQGHVFPELRMKVGVPERSIFLNWQLIRLDLDSTMKVLLQREKQATD
jgi:hypothetical protein